MDHTLLMIKFSDYDINPYIINWIGHFLSNRLQRRLFLGMTICTRRGSPGDKARPISEVTSRHVISRTGGQPNVNKSLDYTTRYDRR